MRNTPFKQNGGRAALKLEQYREDRIFPLHKDDRQIHESKKGVGGGMRNQCHEKQIKGS